MNGKGKIFTKIIHNIDKYDRNGSLKIEDDGRVQQKVTYIFEDHCRIYSQHVFSYTVRFIYTCRHIYIGSEQSEIFVAKRNFPLAFVRESKVFNGELLFQLSNYHATKINTQIKE